MPTNQLNNSIHIIILNLRKNIKLIFLVLHYPYNQVIKIKLNEQGKILQKIFFLMYLMAFIIQITLITFIHQHVNFMNFIINLNYQLNVQIPLDLNQSMDYHLIHYLINYFFNLKHFMVHHLLFIFLVQVYRDLNKIHFFLRLQI